MKPYPNQKITLTWQTDRAFIPVNQPCQRYIHLTLQAPTPGQKPDRMPLNLSLIIDRSGSMSGDKLEYVKEAAIHALRLLTDNDRVSVIVYDDEVQLLSSSRAMTADGREEFIRQIRQVKPGGMTNLSGGWFTGCDQIADYMSNNYLNRALLLTDGLANVGMTDHEQLVNQAKELRRRGITTTTFGVGHNFNQFLLQGIADTGGGHFYFIDKPNQIPNYFNGELGELLTTVAREMTLEINLSHSLSFNLLNDIPYEGQGQSYRLFLGDAYAGEHRDLVLKLDIPAQALEQKILLNGTLRYEDVQQHQPVSINLSSLDFTGATEATCQHQPVNEAVLQEAGRLESEQAKMEALKYEHQGDISGAKNALRQARVVLAEAMPAPMAADFSKELTEMDDEITIGLTEEKRKAKHYTAYRRLSSRKDYKNT